MNLIYNMNIGAHVIEATIAVTLVLFAFAGSTDTLTTYGLALACVCSVLVHRYQKSHITKNQ